MSLVSTPHVFVAGETVTAALLNVEINAAITGIEAAWGTYIPTWTAATTNPVIGNGSVTMLYLQVGKRVDLTIFLTVGTTTTFGSGAYKFTLPVAPNTSVSYQGSGQGTSGASGVMPVMPIIGIGLSTFLYFYVSATTAAGPLNLLSHTGLAGVAWTSASINILRGQITYQAA